MRTAYVPGSRSLPNPPPVMGHGHNPSTPPPACGVVVAGFRVCCFLLRCCGADSLGLPLVGRRRNVQGNP